MSGTTLSCLQAVRAYVNPMSIPPALLDWPGVDVSALLDSPCLPELAEAINERLENERAKRQAFYQDMTDDQKMEFIGGEVVLHSPAKARHLWVKGNILQMMRAHVLHRGLGQVLDEKALCVFPRNDYEPDIVFFGPGKAAQIEPGTMKFPIPDLAVEIVSESTEQRDRGVKFNDYQIHGVGEYWIVDPEAEVVEQFVNTGTRFELRLKSGSGEVESPVITGFRIPIRSCFDSALSLETMKALLDHQA